VHYTDSEKVLLLDPVAPRLIDLPQPAPQDVGNVTIARDVKLGQRGEVSVEETVTCTGYEATGMRAALRPIEPARRAEAIKQMLGGATEVALSRSSITGLDDRQQPVVLKVAYSSARKFSVLPQQLVGALPAPWERQNLMPDTVDDRRNPFRLRTPRAIRSSVTIHLPSGYRAGELPKEQVLDDVFRHARATWKATDKTLHFDLAVTRKTGSHAKEAYDPFVQSAQQLVDALQTHLVLQKAAP